MGGERFEKEAGELKPWGGDGGDRDLREGEEETDPPVVCCAAPGRRRRADSDFDLRAPAVLLCEGLFRRWKWVGLIYGPKWACNMSPWIPECFFFPLTVLMCAIWSACRHGAKQSMCRRIHRFASSLLNELKEVMSALTARVCVGIAPVTLGALPCWCWRGLCIRACTH